MIMRKLTIGLMIVFISTIFVGCKNDNDVEENTNAIIDDQEEQDISNDPVEETFDHKYPLTGIETNEAIDHRIISVMVNNHPAARPQSGLSQADIVFELLAEGNITRFLAMFHSEHPEVVGPVRSAREYYFELASGYDALYVYHGAADFINDMIINRGISHLNGSTHDNDGNLFKREPTRKAPHNSYFLLPAAFDAAESSGYDVQMSIDSLPFLSEEESVTGDPALHVEIGYTENQPRNIVEFRYDGNSETYLRYSDGEQTKELNGEKQIGVENLLIIETVHSVIDDAGRRAIDLESGGSALLLQSGKQQKVQWENREGKIIAIQDGEPIGFVPGKTWVNVVPSIEQAVKIMNE